MTRFENYLKWFSEENTNIAPDAMEYHARIAFNSRKKYEKQFYQQLRQEAIRVLLDMHAIEPDTISQIHTRRLEQGWLSGAWEMDYTFDIFIGKELAYNICFGYEDCFQQETVWEVHQFGANEECIAHYSVDWDENNKRIYKPFIIAD